MVELTDDKTKGAVVTQDGATVPGNASVELPSLRGEEERLKLECNIAQLQAELGRLRKPPLPWWRRGAVVATLTTIIAAVIPVTTAVQAHYEKERQLALEESKQAHEIRTSYLDRLEKPGARLRTLRFVLATTADPSLRQWAQAETKKVQEELDEIDQQIAEIDRQIAEFSSQSHPAALSVEDVLQLPAKKRLDIQVHGIPASSTVGHQPLKFSDP